MRYFLLILAFLLINCGSSLVNIDNVYENPKDDLFTGVDEEIMPYYNRFAEIYNIRINNIPANFTKLESPKAGICYRYRDGSKAIFIDLRQWDSMSDIRKEAIVLHELGHCYFEFDGHDSSTFITEDGEEIPASIMRSELLREDVYEKHRDYYIAELKDK